MQLAILKYLQENLDDNAKLYTFDGKDVLPLFLFEDYQFYCVDILGNTYALMRVESEKVLIKALKKHTAYLSKATGYDVILSFKSVTPFLRKKMIGERMAFLIDDRQMYLPFIGLDIKMRTSINANYDMNYEFKPMEQLIYLFILYRELTNIESAYIAAEMGISKIHAARCLKQLYIYGLLNYEIGGKTGRAKYYNPIESKEYFEKGKPYLKSPIVKRLYLVDVETDSLYAGIDALARQSMLNPPEHSIVAAYKEGFCYEQSMELLDIRANDENYTEVQLWSYDPKKLGRDNCIDGISLSLTLDMDDDRIKGELDDLLGEYEWYTD